MTSYDSWRSNGNDAPRLSLEILNAGRCRPKFESNELTQEGETNSNQEYPRKNTANH